MVLPSAHLPESVAFLSNHGAIGGGEAMLLRMAAAAQAAGIDVTIIGPARPSEMADAAGVRGIAHLGVGGTRRPTQVSRGARVARTGGASLVWCNGLPPALAGTALRQPTVAHLHQPPSPRLARLLPLVRRRSVDVVVPSAATQRAVAGSGVLWNWIEPLDVDRAPREDRLRVGFLGRLSAIKGVDVLANAVGLLTEARPGSVELVIGGDDRFVPGAAAAPVRSALRRVAHVTTLLGWVPPADLLSRVDVLVVPSRWAEPFGLVALEAMAAGVPLVVSDAGALPEVVGADHPWIVPAGDVPALAGMLGRLGSEPDAEQGTTREAHARWRRHFSPEPGAERFLARLAAAVAAS